MGFYRFYARCTGKGGVGWCGMRFGMAAKKRDIDPKTLADVHRTSPVSLPPFIISHTSLLYPSYAIYMPRAPMVDIA